MSNINEPTATAYRWQVTTSKGDEYELACFANRIFDGEVGFRVVYRSTGGDWIYLAEPSIYKDDDFDVKSSEILAAISKKVRSFFLLDSGTPPVPQTLFEQVELLLRSSVEWKEKELTKK
jgi:hypothetical protein